MKLSALLKITMLEPDVTLTDYALAVQCAVFLTLVLRRNPPGPLRKWWAVFFASVGLAALIGGTVHGFLPESRPLWIATLLALGVTSLAGWMIGSYLSGLGWLRPMAVALLAAYVGAVLLVTRDFLIAIAMYLPAALFLLATMIATYRRRSDRAVGAAVAGLLLTFVAAGVQQLRLAPHAVYFDHNALYHLIQFVGLWLLFVGARSPSMAPRAVEQA